MRRVLTGWLPPIYYVRLFYRIRSMELKSRGDHLPRGLWRSPRLLAIRPMFRARVWVASSALRIPTNRIVSAPRLRRRRVRLMPRLLSIPSRRGMTRFAHHSFFAIRLVLFVFALVRPMRCRIFRISLFPPAQYEDGGIFLDFFTILYG